MIGAAVFVWIGVGVLLDVWTARAGWPTGRMERALFVGLWPLLLVVALYDLATHRASVADPWRLVASVTSWLAIAGLVVLAAGCSGRALCEEENKRCHADYSRRG